ncbi:hypothetical protein ACMATS_06370 [Streptoverticillium reticulum]|uniref:hypothetical protein n=1 Tax=Streptoverticillium reticulum TaxID=1433415 RepID=UPI0039BED059
MKGHQLRRRPEGRYQCTRCRAAWHTRGDAAASVQACWGWPLPHGHPYRREHIVYPAWSKLRTCTAWGCEEPDPAHWHGPDKWCDDSSCFCMRHTCDCQVCKGTICAPGLYVLLDPHEL